MDCLPSPVLHQLYSLIWENSPRSLHALSLVSRKCYHAATPFIYRILTIQILTPEKLQREITELLDHPLRQQHYLTYARQLNIKGKMYRSGLSSPEDEQRLLKREKMRDNRVWDVQTGICSEEELEPPFHLLFISDSDDLHGVDPEKSDVLEKGTHASWAPLTSLITKFQFLTELNYNCINQFPSSLLEALHRYQPLCRLNLNKFRFLSLTDSKTDPYELELIRSPCLHGLTFRHVMRNSNGRLDYNEEAVMKTVTIAPNLKEIRSQYCHPMTTMSIHGRRFAPKEAPWKGFIPPFPLEKHP